MSEAHSAQGQTETDVKLPPDRQTQRATMSRNTKYIYIAGAGHSGSTLLSLVLGSTSGISSLGEITHFPRFVKEDVRCSCGNTVSQCAFWQAVVRDLRSVGRLPPEGIGKFRTLPQFLTNPLGKRWVQFLGFLGSKRLTQLSDRLLAPECQSITDRADNDYSLFDAVRRVSGATAVVDSSKYFLRMKFLYLYRPHQFKAIHLVRDGRGVVASDMRSGLSADVAARRWVKANVATDLMKMSMRPASCLRVKYETFCEAPSSELARISRFLGLHCQAEALDFRRGPHHGLGGNRMRFGTSRVIVNPEHWRESLSAADLDTFDRIGGALNRRLGYS